ncbi:MAG: GNAT family N-acetyltransferase [Rhizomicrobium sp.]
MRGQAQMPAEKLKTAPSIKTPRLILRAHALADFPDSFAMWSDPGVARFIGGQPSTEEESWHRFQRYPGHWALMGFGYWLIEETTTGQFAGEMGFLEGKRPLSPGFDGAHEIGWALMLHAQGKGYATEAVAAALAWHDERFGRVRTTCMIAPENAPSIRVAEKAGYAQYAQTTYKGNPTLLFERR